MSNEDKYLSVRVVKEQPIPFNGEEMAPMFRGVIAEQRAFLSGNKHVEVISLSYERTESEAKRRSHDTPGAAIEAAKAISGARWPGADDEYEVVEVLTMVRRVWKGETT